MPRPTAARASRCASAERPERGCEPDGADYLSRMRRTLCKPKIHRATLTGAGLHYEGGLTVDRDLMDADDLLAVEKVLAPRIVSVDARNRRCAPDSEAAVEQGRHEA